MPIRHKTRQHLTALQTVMNELGLWQIEPPSEEAFASTEPFAIDTLTPTEWLQWIFIPRMHALCESQQPLPNQIAISPYIEEALKEHERLQDLLKPLLELEELLKNQ